MILKSESKRILYCRPELAVDIINVLILKSDSKRILYFRPEWSELSPGGGMGEICTYTGERLALHCMQSARSTRTYPALSTALALQKKDRQPTRLRFASRTLGLRRILRGTGYSINLCATAVSGSREQGATWDQGAKRDQGGGGVRYGCSDQTNGGVFYWGGSGTASSPSRH